MFKLTFGSTPEPAPVLTSSDLLGMPIGTLIKGKIGSSNSGGVWLKTSGDSWFSLHSPYGVCNYGISSLTSRDYELLKEPITLTPVAK